MATMLLSKREIKYLLEMPAIIGAVEEAFKSWEQHRASMPPKAYLVVDKGDFRAMPAVIPDAVGIKWVYNLAFQMQVAMKS